MDNVIQQAISLRKQQRHPESRTLLSGLLEDNDYAARAHLHIAWSYDNEGCEREAIAHYLASVAETGKLEATERFDALFGLASTYRCTGDYINAIRYFEQTLEEYPEAIEVLPFYAMCLYNVGQHKRAISILLELLVSTTDNQKIKQYKRAIELYAQDLDREW
ncbi:tetratricopeptide repeat protein [Vibrio sp. SCSIO 43136]|uniref:tetratricopeptide repeat protein n=1 Tax=Vibrio sp. SCSIO 43136 TaxID=2819101 RepID=UPI0020759CD1|nr:tetratricopeptide repeat protein [Vibrio sp. SCSIO 43136]USD67690.1 tetratricopeptide repeat protein [Vibrio sp. SCSIO 43136]